MKYYYYYYYAILALWALIYVSIAQICLSCLVEERRALLDFKVSINATEYPDLILPSWIDEHHHHHHDGEQGYHNDHPSTISDCCNWEGVICSDTTGRIVQLHLSDLEQNISTANYNNPYWVLNLSILLPLENLQALDLSDNSFGSSGLGKNVAPPSLIQLILFVLCCSLILPLSLSLHSTFNCT